MASDSQDMDTLERIKLEITERLEEIRPYAKEVEELEAALAALGSAPTRRITPRRETPQRRTRPRHSSNREALNAGAAEFWEKQRRERMQTVITTVQEKALEDGFTVNDIQELTKRYGIQKKNLSNTILKPMEERGLITRIGQRQHPTGGAPANVFKLVRTLKQEAAEELSA